MVLQYFSSKKGKKPAAVAEEPKAPVLNEEDEAFLKRITSDEQMPSQPAEPVVVLEGGEIVKGKDAQDAIMDGANQIPLPTSPPPANERTTAAKDPSKRKAYFSYIQSRIPVLPFSKVPRYGGVVESNSLIRSRTAHEIKLARTFKPLRPV
jgi:hypothetical protein